MYPGINIVAIHNLDGDPGERAAALAAAIGVTLFEARNRVRPPVPTVVACCAERPHAEKLVLALAAARFEPFLLRGEEIEDDGARVVVRSFELSPGSLRLETRSGAAHIVRDEEIGLLLRGTTTVREAWTETTTKRKLSLSRAVLTGGLQIRKKKKVETTVVQQKSEGFIHLYPRGGPTFVFRETELLYQGLGPAMQASRTANFLQLLCELRSRAGNAVFDERLLNRGGQNHALGGVLSPDSHLDVAIAVIVFGAKRP